MFANDRDIAVGRLVQITSLLASVRSALDRIADGSYGVCLCCGEAIGPNSPSYRGLHAAVLARRSSTCRAMRHSSDCARLSWTDRHFPKCM
jgi:RNA polymerase-binding transcription factor DksA